MQRYSHLLFVVMFFSVTSLVGCASPPIRSEYFTDKPPLREGSYVDQVWFDEGSINTLQYSEIRLEAVRGVGISDQTNVAVSDAVRWLTEAITEPGKGSIVLQSSGPGRVAILEVVITELNPGSTVARFWAGEFGVGHAWVQIEGKLIDAINHKLLGYFVERDRKSGVATLRNSRGYDSGPGLIHDIIEDVGEKVRKEIKSALHL